MTRQARTYSLPGSYAMGFWAGEAAAFFDRKNGNPPAALFKPNSQWEQGWNDGYTPRNPAWVTERHVEVA